MLELSAFVNVATRVALLLTFISFIEDVAYEVCNQTSAFILVNIARMYFLDCQGRPGRI